MVAKTIQHPGLRAIQPVLLRTTATAKAAVQLEMARSSFSVSEVCQIVCEDGDEEYIFSGSDDDLGMDDLEDDNLLMMSQVSSQGPSQLLTPVLVVPPARCNPPR